MSERPYEEDTDSVSAEAPTPEDLVIEKSRAALVRRAIDALPPEWQIATRLHLEGLTSPEIAARMDRSDAAVRSMLLRARRHLARTLKSEGEET